MDRKGTSGMGYRNSSTEIGGNRQPESDQDFSEVKHEGFQPADPNLHNELDGFISNLERIAVLESEPSLSDRS